MVGDAEAEEGLLGDGVAGVAAIEGFSVGGGEIGLVFGIDGLLKGNEDGLIDAGEHGGEIEVSAVHLTNRDDADGPFEVGAGFVEVEFGQRPVLLLTREPEVGEMVRHVFHGVGLIGHLAF